MNETSGLVSVKDKKRLEKNISKLSDIEYNQILQIIINNNQKYSENTGGIFVNLKYINNKTITEINKYVDSIMDNKKKLNEGETIIKEKMNQNDELVYEEPDKFTLKKEEILLELERLHTKKNENFIFQNFLDKLSLTNIKSFKKNEKIVYPNLNTAKKKFNGVNERLLKKCREVNRDEQNIFSLNDYSIENNDRSENSKNIEEYFRNQILVKNEKIENEEEDFIEEELIEDEEDEDEMEESEEEDEDYI